MKDLGYQNLRCHTPAKQFGGSKNPEAFGSILSLQAAGDSVFAIYSDLSFCSYKLYHVRGAVPFQFKNEKIHCLTSKNASMSLSYGGHNDLHLNKNANHRPVVGTFAMTSGGISKVSSSGVTSTESSYLLMSCCYFDNVVKIHSFDSLQLRSNQHGGHRGRINCLQVGEDGTVMVTGGQDATCRVWVVDHYSLAAALADGFVQSSIGEGGDGGLQEGIMTCCHVLLGHASPITCIAISTKLDVVVSGSEDGSICVHNIRSGQFIRSLHVDSSTKELKHSCACNGMPVKKLAIHMDGSFVAHLSDGSIHLITINGKHITSAHVGETLNSMIICSQSETLITGGEQGCARIWKIHDLSLQCTVDVEKYGAITSLALTSPDASSAVQFLCVGSSNGLLSIVFRSIEGKQ